MREVLGIPSKDFIGHTSSTIHKSTVYAQVAEENGAHLNSFPAHTNLPFEQLVRHRGRESRKEEHAFFSKIFPY